MSVLLLPADAKGVRYMKHILRTSLAVSSGAAIVRLIQVLRHPEWSVPAWLPVAVAWIGSFIGAFAVLTLLRLLNTRCKAKEPS